MSETWHRGRGKLSHLLDTQQNWTAKTDHLCFILDLAKESQWIWHIDYFYIQITNRDSWGIKWLLYVTIFKIPRILIRNMCFSPFIGQNIFERCVGTSQSPRKQTGVEDSIPSLMAAKSPVLLTCLKVLKLRTNITRHLQVLADWTTEPTWLSPKQTQTRSPSTECTLC